MREKKLYSKDDLAARNRLLPDVNADSVLVDSMNGNTRTGETLRQAEIRIHKTKLNAYMLITREYSQLNEHNKYSRLSVNFQDFDNLEDATKAAEEFSA